MKLLVIGIILLFESELEAGADWFLSLISFNPSFELAFIMVIVPLILNASMYWITDCFLKYTRKEGENDDTKYSQTFEIHTPFIEI
jgi:hypothetical protein